MEPGDLMIGQQYIKFVPTHIRAQARPEDLTQNFPVWTVGPDGKSSPYRSMRSGTRLIVVELKPGIQTDVYMRVKVMTPDGEHVWCLSCHLVKAEVPDESR